MGFLLRLWRGEVSLNTTYWIFGALVVFMFEVFESAGAAAGDILGTVTVISAIYYIFIAVAIFRSSMRYSGSRMFIIFTQLTAISLIFAGLWRLFAASVIDEVPVP